MLMEKAKTQFLKYMCNKTPDYGTEIPLPALEGMRTAFQGIENKGAPYEKATLAADQWDSGYYSAVAVKPEMKFESFKEVCMTPEGQADFLAQLVAVAEVGRREKESLYACLSRSVTLESEPFSCARHMIVLEDCSDGWDVDEMPSDVMKTIAVNALALKRMDETYDLPHAITGFHCIVEELENQGVELGACGDTSPSPL